jgi:hypothetical protein
MCNLKLATTTTILCKLSQDQKSQMQQSWKRTTTFMLTKKIDISMHKNKNNCERSVTVVTISKEMQYGGI